MRARIWTSILVALTLGALPLAQDQDGVISGVVIDASGAALPGVTVTLSGPEERTTVTDSRGEFVFVGLHGGQYQLESTLAGFTTVRRYVTVAGGRTERLTIEMRVGALEETITVTAAGPVISVQRMLRSPSFQPSGRMAGFTGGRRNDAGFNTERYQHIEENGFRRVDVEPLSTFSIDVDTASYANTRRFLAEGELPPPGAVRIEEMINYFRFDYPQPSGDAPFSITTELAASPWNPKHRLALIGLQGRVLADDEPAPRNLVFLLDVSGSMMDVDKLPLVQTAMGMLTDVLTSRDRVAIVVYAGASGLVLPSTSGDQRGRIHRALARLQAGGSTNGAEGITLAYEVARENFMPRGVNRVILATDGDFNVGITNDSELVKLIEHERKSGIFLSVLGVGTDNVNDSMMELLADKGNGNYSYLDSVREAHKVLVREANSTLETIAKDVKIQIEFNPREVAAYRLIGYENRLLDDEDFNDDAKDAGEIGAGHSVTALYEIVPAGGKVDVTGMDPLKYQREARQTRAARSGELMTVKVRYKTPRGATSRLLTHVLMNRPSDMSPNLGFVSAVAEFGMLLRESAYRGQASFDSLRARAKTFLGDDKEGYRAEFVRLVDRTASLRDSGR